MAEPAIRRMTVDEFLDWDDGTDTRYELIDGLVVAMAPAMPRHAALSGRLVGALNPPLSRRPQCTAYVEAGVARPDRNDTCYVPDVTVSCDPSDEDDRYIRHPVLVVEILSPSTRRFDRNRKVADYQAIPSVQEILLLDSRRVFAEIFRREGDRWVTEVTGGPDATLTLLSIPVSIAMTTLYRAVRSGRQTGE